MKFLSLTGSFATEILMTKKSAVTFQGLITSVTCMSNVKALLINTGTTVSGMIKAVTNTRKI